MLEMPKCSGADSLLRRIQFLLQYDAKRVSRTELMRW